MSRTGEHSTGEPNLLDRESQAGTALQGKDPGASDLPGVERESASQSLLRRLRLPLTLAYILKNQPEEDQLDQEMRSAVFQRSVTEQQRLRSFAQSLYHICNGVLGRASFSENDKIDTSHEFAHERKDQDDTSGGNSNATIQPEVQHNDNSGPQFLHSEDAHAEKRSRLESDATCTANFRPSNCIRGTKGRVKLTSKRTTMPLPRASSPEVEPSIEPMTPERTPSRASRTNLASATAKDTCDSGCLYLLHQVTDDFVRDSYGDIQLFHLLENDLGTYKAVLDSLTNPVCYMNQEESDEVQWSDGSQWVSLLEAGNKSRQQGALCYALTAIAFARWHESQARLVRSATRPEEAAQDVSARILRSRLGPRDETSHNDWERSRKNLNTHLARGRKWSRLVEELGSGILFKNAWKLAKSSQQELDILIRELPKDATKTTILRLLADQMTILLQTGKTDPDEFRKRLGAEGLPSLSLPPRHMPGKRNDDIYTPVRRCIDSDKVHIKGTGFEFGVESLRKFPGDEWLNDEIILACLHLSDRLPFVRVGSCIPIHQETKPRIMPRPFEKAKKQMKTWHDSDEELIGIFPLLLHNMHFSLLEINEREKCVFHYDSLGRSGHEDLKKACEKEFPNLQFVDKKAVRQTDGSSCGPLVIKHARCRMMSRPVISRGLETYDAEELRIEAAQILYSALQDDRLTVVTEGRKRKRTAKTNRQGKRWQVDDLNLRGDGPGQ